MTLPTLYTASQHSVVRLLYIEAVAKRTVADREMYKLCIAVQWPSLYCAGYCQAVPAVHAGRKCWLNMCFHQQLYCPTYCVG